MSDFKYTPSEDRITKREKIIMILLLFFGLTIGMFVGYYLGVQVGIQIGVGLP